ncbi:MAG: type II secretion system protein [Candidatus Omnitrophica bacterium]|nr:type II secretion system protein [Candidatus Omnitrophota bacterium]
MMNKKAVTLMELMVAVMVVGIIAAFAIPNYTKANNKAEERQMITNMRSIVAAQEIYKAQNGNYWPAATGSVPIGNIGVAGINAALKLNVSDDPKYTYQCNAPSNQAYQCYGTYSPGGTLAWQIHANQVQSQSSLFPQQVCCDSAMNPGNPCPTLPWCT